MALDVLSLPYGQDSSLVFFHIDGDRLLKQDADSLLDCLDGDCSMGRGNNGDNNGRNVGRGEDRVQDEVACNFWESSSTYSAATGEGSAMATTSARIRNLWNF